MTRRLAGTGLRPALVFTAGIVAPGAYAVARWLGARIDGFPAVGTAVLAVVVALAGTALVSYTPSPRFLQLVGRAAALALVAVAVRLTVPSPGVAIGDLLAGEAGLLSYPFTPLFLLLLTAHVVGHAVGARVALFAEGARTKPSDRSGEQALVAGWLAGVGATVLLLGVAGRAAGWVGALLAVVGVGAAGAVVAHLRSATPHPGGRRPPVVLGPRRLRWRAGLVGLALAGLLGLVVTAVLPPVITEASPRFLAWLTDLEPDFGSPTPPLEPRGPDVEHGDVGAEPYEERELPERGRPELEPLAWWPLGLVGGLVALVLLVYLLRADRWRAVLRAVWSWLRRPGPRIDPGADTSLEPVEPDPNVRRLRSPRRSFERFRPRPRDPRGAILHDYLRLQRLLQRHDLGRSSPETPLEHADRVELGDEHRELATLVGVARYGRDVPPVEAAERSRELQRQLVRTVRRG